MPSSVRAKKFNWTSFIKSFPKHFPFHGTSYPWDLIYYAEDHIHKILQTLGDDYALAEGLAIHATATIETNVIIKPPAIIGPGCFIAANCYLRGGVFLMGNNTLGPGCEIKTSILFPSSHFAHFNFVGDSVIGAMVNFEAGAITANHHNDKEEKEIIVLLMGKKFKTHTEKFGSLIGDHCKIGANAVLSPGTILTPKTVVKRLQLDDQQRKK